MITFKRRYASTYASVTEARHDVVGFATACGATPDQIADIALGVGEACNNAAEHGHVDGGYFSVECRCDKGHLVVEVCDEGKGFLLAGKGEHVDPEARGARGLGIFLMRSLMDDVAYEIGEHGTGVRLSKMLKVDRDPLHGLADREKSLAKSLGVHPSHRS